MNKTKSLAKPCPKHPTHKRARGQLVWEIIQLIIENPDITLTQMACRLNCRHENVRKRYVKILEQPERYAAMVGCSKQDLKKALMGREGKIGAGARSFHSHWPGKKSEWRGKADWPAKKVASQGIKGNTAILAYRDRFEREI